MTATILPWLKTRSPAPHRPGRQVEAPTAPAPSPMPAGPTLLEAVGAGPADRVLAVGAGADAEVICAALRRGCRGAAVHPCPPPHPEPVEVVIAPRVEDEGAALAALACGRRALGAGGRMALRLLGKGAFALARALAAQLRRDGFERVRLRAQAEGDLLLVCRRLGGGAGAQAATAR
jgi:hypothetical protein